MLGGAVGLVRGDGAGGAVGAHHVTLGDVVVLTHRAGALAVVGFKALFQVFGELKPVLKKNGEKKNSLVLLLY